MLLMTHSELDLLIFRFGPAQDAWTGGAQTLAQSAALALLILTAADSVEEVG